jgi:hypothetical protein
MKKYSIAFLIMNALLWVNCQSESQAPAMEENNVQAAPSLPVMPVEEIERMRTGCTGIDYTFLEPSFSMSVDDPAEVQADFGFIGTDAPALDPACRPIAMIFYKQGTERFYDAELYLTGTCLYLIFTKNGERIYANALSEDGVANFQGILEYMKGEMQKMQNGQ